MNVSSMPAPAPAYADRAAAARALRNLVWLTGDKVVSVVLGLLVFGLVARAFGPQGAGWFSYGAAVLQATLGFALVCSSAAVLPRLCDLSDGAAARAVVNVFAVRQAGAWLATAAVATYVALAVDDPVRRSVTLVMLAGVPLLEPFAAFSAYWLSRNRNGPPVMARVSGLVLRVAVVAAALWAGAAPWVVALAWAAEAVLTAAVQTLQLGVVRPWRTLVQSLRVRRSLPYLRFGVRFAFGLWLSHLFLRLDRLWLAEHVTAHEFGLYATAMQLVEVWLQVAMLLAGSMAPAFLYGALRRSRALVDHWHTLALLGGLGLAGLAGVALFGRPLLGLVYGPGFADGHGYLVAGFAAAALGFVDQFVQVSITANNRPGVLALKWGTACAIALAVLLPGSAHLGAYAGPLALAAGFVGGWIAVALAYRWQHRRSNA